MATYPPPTETLPTFNSTVFTSPLTDGLTIAEADARYLKFPIGQGDETISNLNVVGTLTAGTVAPTTLTTNTIQGTAVGTAVSLYNEVARTGEIQIGKNGTSTKTITIGNDTATTTALKGSSITATRMAITNALSAGASTLTSVATSDITTSAPTGFSNLFQNVSSGNINVGTIGSSGTIFIGNNSPITANTQGVQILSGGLGTGELWLGNGGTRTIRLGSSGTTTINIGNSGSSIITIGGSTVSANKLAVSGLLTAGSATVAGTLGAGILNAGASTLASASITGLMSSATATVAGSLSAGASLLASASITGLMSSATATVAGLLTAGSATITGALSVGSLSLTSLITNTINGTAVGTAVSLYGEVSRSGAIEIGNGSSRSGDIRIGNGATTTGAVVIGTNGGGVSIGTTGSTNTINGTTNFSNGTTTIFGNTNINITGTNDTVIGNTTSGTLVTINGGVLINDTGSLNTGIGNTSGTTTFKGAVDMTDTVTLGSSSVDTIVPNGTLTKPFLIGYSAQSSFSLSSATLVNTFLGGTIQSTNTFSGVATGTFKYCMESATAIAPYTVGGGISLLSGTYMFWIGVNFEDASSFTMTDIRIGMSNVNTIVTGSTEAQFVASAPNLTCYFHKTDSADSVASDSENRTLAGVFTISATTTMFPWWRVNQDVTLDTVKNDVIIVRIGSA